jgi:hypothetical protein
VSLLALIWVYSSHLKQRRSTIVSAVDYRLPSSALAPAFAKRLLNLDNWAGARRSPLAKGGGPEEITFCNRRRRLSSPLLRQNLFKL